MVKKILVLLVTTALVTFLTETLPIVEPRLRLAEDFNVSSLTSRRLEDTVLVHAIVVPTIKNYGLAEGYLAEVEVIGLGLTNSLKVQVISFSRTPIRFLREKEIPIKVTFKVGSKSRAIKDSFRLVLLDNAGYSFTESSFVLDADIGGRTFKWSRARGAKAYFLQLCLGSNGRGAVFDTTVVDTTAFIPGLVQGQYYYWRVRTEYANKRAFWSPMRFDSGKVGEPMTMTLHVKGE